LNLPFHLEQVDLPQMKSRLGKGNLEALGRDERYRFFAAVARRHGIKKIATAHTQDDQAETVLMRLLRGAGRKGLAGIVPVSQFKELTLIRPMLEISKAEILDFLKEKNAPYRIDRTNQDTQLLRNWVRVDLIKQLDRRMGPQLSLRLAQQAAILRDEEIVLDEMAKAQLEQIRTSAGLQRDGLLKQRKAMQRRIIRRWIEESRGSLRAIDFDHIENFLDLIQGIEPQARLSIPGDWELIKEYETLRLQKKVRGANDVCYSYDFRIGTALHVMEAGMTFEGRQVSAPLAKKTNNLLQVAFDSAVLPEALMVRNFRPGDRFRPLGMSGHKKLKELFIEKKVPYGVRLTLPLLSTRDEILWIPGYGRSDFGKIRSETKKILYIEAMTTNR
jgi:tRNA(Ile)-lysidine synthase